MNTKRGAKFAIKRATDPCKRYVSSNASSSAPHSQTSSEIHTRRSSIFNTRCTAKAIITGARCAIVLALCNHRARHIVWEESGQVPSAKVAGASNESRWKRSGSSCVARASPRPRSNDGMFKSLGFFLLSSTRMRWSRRWFSLLVRHVSYRKLFWTKWILKVEPKQDTVIRSK